jgi:hypothetical protein
MAKTLVTIPFVLAQPPPHLRHSSLLVQVLHTLSQMTARPTVLERVRAVRLPAVLAMPVHQTQHNQLMGEELEQA